MNLFKDYYYLTKLSYLLRISTKKELFLDFSKVAGNLQEIFL